MAVGNGNGSHGWPDYSATAFAGQGYVGADLARLRARLMVSIMVADAGPMVAAILAPAA